MPLGSKVRVSEGEGFSEVYRLRSSLILVPPYAALMAPCQDRSLISAAAVTAVETEVITPV